MASIRKRGDRWQVQVRRLGFPLQSKSFLTKRDADVWARQLERQIDQADLPVDASVLATIQLSDLVARYRDEITPRKKGAEVETIVLNRFMSHRICRKTLNQLLPSDFAEYRDERLSQVTSATLRRQLNPLHNMFEVAKVDWNIPLRENPLDKLTLTVVHRRRERRLKQGELNAIVTAAKRTRNQFILPIVLFAIETGMRRGEILKVTWQHIDLDRRSLVIPEAKNGHSRVVPLSRKAIDILNERTSCDSLIFPITANALRLAWDRLIANARLEDLHFHDLRHEAISRFFELGLTVPEISSISGHRDVRMLMRYGHASQSLALEKLG